MAALMLAMSCVVLPTLVNGAQNQKLRPAGVAGSFYPAEPAALTAMMDSMMSRVSLPTIDGEILAVVAPHAGYPFSGPVAAYTYAALKGHKFARVVVIAPSHYEAFGFTSVYDGDAYETPLGAVDVDTAFARQLAKANSSIQLSQRGHTATSNGAEHAVEVQLPWLQHVLGSFQLVPVVMGDQSYDSSRALGVALAKVIESEKLRNQKAQRAGSDTLIVASSDLSHYHTYDEAVNIDHKTLNALESWDYFNMARNFGTRVWEACGGAPIVAAMIAAQRMGADKARVLRYANSGDVAGDRSRVVGYSADVFVKSHAERRSETPFSLSEQQKKALLSVARKSVENAVHERKLYEAPATGDASLDQERGAFVTLRKAGELRGCIGYTMPVEPLYKTVRDVAALAAVQDPRFPPVTDQELSKLEYEISVLSPLVRVLSAQQIEVGKDGLLIRNGSHEGLLLPQVPVEQHWDRATFLSKTCVKAGLEPDCWQKEDTDIFRFSALVFSDRPSAALN